MTACCNSSTAAMKFAESEGGFGVSMKHAMHGEMKMRTMHYDY